MPKHRNPPKNFTIKGGSIHLTGAKKKLSPSEEEELRLILSQRYWSKFFKGLGNAFQLAIKQNRSQSVTDNQPKP